MSVVAEGLQGLDDPRSEDGDEQCREALPPFIRYFGAPLQYVGVRVNTGENVAYCPVVVPDAGSRD